jgi:glycosidase
MSDDTRTPDAVYFSQLKEEASESSHEAGGSSREPIYWDDSDEEEEEAFLQPSLEEEKHLTKSWIKPPREQDMKRVVFLFLLGCGFLSIVVIATVGVVAGLQAKKLRSGGHTTTTSSYCAAIPPSTSTQSPSAISSGLEWWKTSVIYQCYPRSYQDCDADGSGDLSGLISRVGYLSDIGVRALWLNPIFQSPQKDNGYDISNYTDIDPLFGTMEQVQMLIRELHSRNMHLLMDFVPNHTSDQHPWFLESRQSRTNPKRKWYVWADGREDGGPPNNWISVFGGSAWTYDNHTSQYYLHQFSSFQPDLNYWNPEVVSAFEDVLRFWLDLGVDGFRIDAVAHLLEDPALPDEVVNPHHSPDCLSDCYDYLIHSYTRSYEGIHNITRAWRQLLDLYSTTRPRFMVGEVYDPIDVVMSYYGGEDGDEFHFPFNFFLLGNSEWTGTNVDRVVSLWLDNMPMGGWPNWVLGNHDNHRIASKAGPFLARALNVLLLTLPGTPTTYYGEEILMTDVDVKPDLRQDKYGDRDKERTPMQWNSKKNAGFTSATPWLPLAENYSTVNVQSELGDDTSMLSLYKRLVEMRSNYSAFMEITYTSIISTQDVLVFIRDSASDPTRFLVALNFARYTVSINSNVLPSILQAEVYLSSYMNRTGTLDITNDFNLLGGEGLILKWDQ